MTRYRTIVADPPWPLKGAGPRWSGRGKDTWTKRNFGEQTNTPTRSMAYRTMSVDEIAALPVGALALEDAHLYLWTMNAFMEDAYRVARAWGFRPAQLLTWVKTPRGLGLGGAFTSTTEFVLFCRRGTLDATTRTESTWWNWKRPEDSGGPAHSRKPDGFLDTVEAVSPGPYVELFARRARFGWDYWGDESLGTASIASTDGEAA